jgi:hypothetical protein
VVAPHDLLGCLQRARDAGLATPGVAASGDDFPEGCLAALRKTEILQAGDPQLQPFLREECAADAGRLCADAQGAAADDDDDFDDDDDGQHDYASSNSQGSAKKEMELLLLPAASSVVACLAHNLGSIRNPACKARVKEQAARRAGDIRMAPSVRRACEDDIRRFCPREAPAFVHACLRTRFDELAEACRQAEFEEIRVEMKADFLVNPAVRVRGQVAVG